MLKFLHNTVLEASGRLEMESGRRHPVKGFKCLSEGVREQICRRHLDADD